ncbi:hypothetical protein BH11PSE2_BH11PSE2_06490 [soil metagenome]
MSGNGWKIALAISLAVNVFGVGALVGAMGKQATQDPRRAPPPIGNPLMRAGDQLSPEQQQAFRAMMRARAQTAQPLLREARQDRLDAAKLFGASEFDKTAASAALAKARTADFTARQDLEAAVVDFAATLNVEDRKKLAQGLREPPRGPGGMGGRGGRRGMRGGMGGPPLDGRPDGRGFGPPDGQGGPEGPRPQ